jgi:murein DD-endopeptidase MepM/ murein hydrolase activator NlpD
MAYAGDKKNNANWTGFGSEVLAVADGIVVEVQDGIRENVPFSPDRPVEITPQTSGGNFVTVDIGSRHFAYFAHMQPKSIRVKLGDHVQRGQVLGLLGNTGNSTNAHLHFHVSTGKRPGGGEGIPIIFNTFHLLGHADFTATVGLIARPVGWRATSIGKNGERRNEMPLENDVLKFP